MKSEKADHVTKDKPRLPLWLRRRYSHAIQAATDQVIEEAKRTGREPGVIADRRIKAILADAGERNPSPATVEKYRRAYLDMLAENQTPADKASTFQHFNFLRSAWRYCEAEQIRALRVQSDIARRAKDYARMTDLTGRALQRAAVFDALFLQDDRPTWKVKAQALRAKTGTKPPGKSKKAAGRVAPTPDELLGLLAQQRKRCVRVELAAMACACFGVRPQELVNGVRLVARGKALGLEVKGAKVDAIRGQARRMLVISAERFGQSGLAVSMLLAEANEGRTGIKLNQADLRALRRALAEAQAGLSPYAYRHARASDVKAASGGDRGKVAQWLGHSTDRAQSYYGNSKSSSGAVRIEGATASTPVRAVKTLPGHGKRGAIPVVVALSAKIAASQAVKKGVRLRDYKPPSIPRAPKPR